MKNSARYQCEMCGRSKGYFSPFRFCRTCLKLKALSLPPPLPQKSLRTQLVRIPLNTKP